MSSQRPISELFHAARERGAEDRNALLEDAAAGGPALRREVESLLEAADEAEGFLGTRYAREVLAEVEAPPDERALERRVGPYRLVREIGRGGMGTVYLAEREDGQFRQRVAVKLIKRGMDTDFIVERFRRERQILAALDHPHIARLLDGGATEGGQPYLVMEHVEGEAITRYCDRQRLPVEERLELFRSVCDAVHYAHQNLVIHRDLKPGNILVTGEGSPRLLDFGTAKLLDPGAYGTDLPPTATGFRPLTPEYASPEQLRGEAITTASDVYALGVLLYELLTGRHPYPLPAHCSPEVARVVSDVAPPPPSAVVARRDPRRNGRGPEPTPEALAHARRSHPEGLGRRLAGDLDNVVLMCLRTDPQRRYPSAEQLSEDLRRHLEDLPVRARPDTLAYRAGKFLRRNRAGVAGAASAVGALVAGLVVARRQTHLARRAKDRAEEQKRATEKTSEFLVDVLGALDPYGEVNDRQEIEKLVEQEVSRVLAEDCAWDPRALAMLVTLCSNLELSEDGLKLGLRALGWAERDSWCSADYVRVLWAIANALGVSGDVARACSVLEGAVRLAESLRINDTGVLLDVKYDYAYLLIKLGLHRRAERLLRQILPKMQQLYGDNHPKTLDALGGLGVALIEEGSYESAANALNSALESWKIRATRQHPKVFELRTSIAYAQRFLGYLEQAEQNMHQAFAKTMQIRGPESPTTINCGNVFALVLIDRAKYDEAESIAVSTLKASFQALRINHRFVANSINCMALLAFARGDDKSAERLQRHVVALRRAYAGERHPGTLWSWHNIADVLAKLSKTEEAEDLYRHALTGMRDVLRPGHPHIARPLAGLGALLTELGRLDEAEGHLREAVAIRYEALGEEHWMTAETESLLGACLAERQQYEEAEELLRKGLATLDEQLGAEHPRTGEARERLARLGEVRGDVADEAGGRL